MAEFETIMNDATATMRRLLRAAYEAGLEAGRKEGSAELRSKLAAIIETDIEPAKLSLAPGQDEIDGPVDADADRAPHGSVKPAVLEYVQRNPHGLTANEISERTGIKYNSVRGSLWKLGKERAVYKHGENWFPTSEQGSKK